MLICDYIVMFFFKLILLILKRLGYDSCTQLTMYYYGEISW